MEKHLGYHIIADFYDCQDRYSLINHELYIKDLLRKIKENGMNPLNVSVEYFGTKNNSAYSLVIILAESHISFHTFPEKDEFYKNCIDIYTCSISRDNTEGCRFLYEYIKDVFKPLEIKGENFLKRY